MKIVERIGSRGRASERIVGILAGVLVLAALVSGLVLATGSAAREGRCRDLSTSAHRSDYLRFEVEGCSVDLGRVAR